MKFRVGVKKNDGTQENRVIEAATRFAVYEQLEKEGLQVVTLEEQNGFILPSWANLQFGSGIKTEQRIAFTKNLSAMLSAGLTLSRALSVIERQTDNKYLKKILIDLENRVKAGASFHEALAEYPNIFSKLFVAMTKAGEESGKLSDTLQVVAKQMDSSYTLTKKVKGAMIYPSIILFAIFIIAILMLMFVVPTLSATFLSLNVALPLSTQIIVGMSNFVLKHSVLVLGFIALATAGMYAFIKSVVGGKIILSIAQRLPIIGELVRETFSARAARTLSSLLSSGVEMLTAISIAGEVVGDNPFGKVLVEAAERVKKGEELSVAFINHGKLYPLFVSEMISVGEETGKVADMLGQVAEYYENDVSERTKDHSTIIEPILMLFIGAFVGVFAVSMIAPIYSLSSKI
jgi:type IV pilus assembly protein PilC